MGEGCQSAEQAHQAGDQGDGAKGETMPAYYNEYDKHAAAWLRQLIREGRIAPGEVDERSISDVQADDLRRFTQCHFFAGIGGWSYALRLAGWADDRPVWTGSCPCQPFSSAGKRKGTEDSRHLWPVFAKLIDACRPPIVFGEQVASADGRDWLSGVFADLEAMEYQRAAADLCAAGVGAPHIRQRLYWVGVANGSRSFSRREAASIDGHRDTAVSTGSAGGLANPETAERGSIGENNAGRRAEEAGGSGGIGGLALPAGEQKHPVPATGFHAELGSSCRLGGLANNNNKGSQRLAGNGFIGNEPGRIDQEPPRPNWCPADIIPCRDGKRRRIEPGTQPLAHGIPRGMVPSGDPGSPGYAENTAEARVMRLRGYGNAIVPQVAAVFVRSLFGS